MNFWQVLVLAVVCQGCDDDYATLSHAANHDSLVRAFLQVGPLADEGFAEKTVHETVSNLRPSALEQIVYLISQTGLGMCFHGFAQTPDVPGGAGEQESTSSADSTARTVCLATCRPLCTARPDPTPDPAVVHAPGAA